MNPGEIHRHDAFYRNRDTGAPERKFVLALARTVGGDVIARLLTSRAHGRREVPRCYHGLPYSGYYLGVLGGQLTAKSWVDLRYLDDLDAADVSRLRQRGTMQLVTSIDRETFTDALDCVAAADDTTRAQENAIRDLLANMRTQ